MPENPVKAPDPATADDIRLRAAIDSGETRDKVAVSDPSASPLGTDNEAAQPHDEAGLKIARAAKPPAKEGQGALPPETPAKG